MISKIDRKNSHESKQFNNEINKDNSPKNDLNKKIFNNKINTDINNLKDTKLTNI